LVNGRGGLKWERGEVVEDSWEERRRGGKWECTKTALKRNRFDIGDAPLRLPSRVIHFWKILSGIIVSIEDSMPIF